MSARRKGQVHTATGHPQDDHLRFMAGVEGAPSLGDDDRLALLCAAVANQQRAGFGNVIDAREFPCPFCKAPGFNLGWGYTQHTCGGEFSCSDGETFEPCGKAGERT